MIKELLFRWAMWSIDLLFEIWFHDKKINISFRLFGMIILHALSDTRKKVKKKILICSIIHAKHVLIICLPFHWKENRYSFIFENLKIEFVQSLWINIKQFLKDETYIPWFSIPATGRFPIRYSGITSEIFLNVLKSLSPYLRFSVIGGTFVSLFAILISKLAVRMDTFYINGKWAKYAR